MRGADRRSRAPALTPPPLPPPPPSQGTLDYRVHFSYGGHAISPWHDIPLAAGADFNGPLHFCCEIPKWTRRKFEVRRVLRPPCTALRARLSRLPAD